VLAGSPLALYIGRGAGYALALEGALKLKEIAYVPAEGCAAGELKHGPIALVEPGLPVVAVVQDGLLGQKLLANVDEVRARGGRILAVCRGDDEEARARATDRLLVPTTDAVAGPMLAALPLQLLAYYAACAAGHDVDRPRNLAKSVTVE
jgi:glucosamine--fructose-6-phosphate aminotransferase (isomerizing)